jgi:hypothetical protein
LVRISQFFIFTSHFILSRLFAIPQLHGIAYGLFASVVAPIGGFMASAIKRASGVKDFENFLPGHGGVMDRMDCQVEQLYILYSYTYTPDVHIYWHTLLPNLSFYPFLPLSTSFYRVVTSVFYFPCAAGDDGLHVYVPHVFHPSLDERDGRISRSPRIFCLATAVGAAAALVCTTWAEFGQDGSLSSICLLALSVQL